MTWSRNFMISQIYSSPEVPANPGAKTTTTQKQQFGLYD